MSKRICNTKRIKIASITDWKCWYCGDDLDDATLNIDHLQPRSLGGSNDCGNLVPSCRTCNTAKGIKSIEEYRLYESLKNSKYGTTITTRQYIELASLGLISVVPERHEFYFEKIGE